MNNEEMKRLLLEQLGLKWEDLPTPTPPTEQELQCRVMDLMDADKATAAADQLLEWPDQAVPVLRTSIADSNLLGSICGAEPLQIAADRVIRLLCKSAPDVIVANLHTLSEFPDETLEICIEAAFRQDPCELLPRFKGYVELEEISRVSAALIGIRNAVLKDGFPVRRLDALYRCCLNICAPEYPQKQPDGVIAFFDPAAQVCQVFGSWAERDLCRAPYFSMDNRHFGEILRWLPSVVSYATRDLVRSEFSRAIDACGRDSVNHAAFARFLPLAAARLGEECREDLRRMRNADGRVVADPVRGALTKALAIVECGRDPLPAAWDAVSDGRLESLTRFERVVPLVLAFDGEVRNGGIFQFLFNSSGIHAAETLDCLRMLGDLAGQALLEAGVAAAMSESDAPSPHAAARQLGTSLLRRRYGASIAELSTAYQKQEPADARVYEFVLQHAHAFRAS
jgi:hypothetical protein